MRLQTCALPIRSEEHTSELQSHDNLVCRLLLENRHNAGRGPWLGPMLLLLHGLDVRALWSSARRARVRGGELVTYHLDDGREGAGFFLNDAAPTEFYPFPLQAALPL